MEKQVEEQMGKLQLLEQNLQQFLQQRQQFQAQLMEVDSALEEIENTKQAYKIVGNVMIASEKPALKKELGQKKEMLGLRITSLEKQEEKIREKVESMRKDVMKKMKV
jgi:prefoldin beta subunit